MLAPAVELARRHRSVLIGGSLIVILSSFMIGNLVWAARSPVYQWGDSLTNIHVAILYGRLLSGSAVGDASIPSAELGLPAVQADGGIYCPQFVEGSVRPGAELGLFDLLRFRHPPPWFLVLGAAFALMGFKASVVILVQSILGALTLVMTFVVGRRFHGSIAGLVACLMLSTLPSFVVVTRQGFLETMLWPLLIASVLLMESVIRRPDARTTFAWLGLACGSMLLVKTSASLYFPIVLVLVVISLLREHLFSTKVAGNILVSIAAFSVPVLPYYLLASETIGHYSRSSLNKAAASFEPEHLWVFVPILRRAQLGTALFLALALGVMWLSIRKHGPGIRMAALCLTGYVVVASVPIATVVRHYSPFLPLLMLLIAGAAAELGRARAAVMALLVVMSLAVGYGWAVPGYPWSDEMVVFYDEVGVKETRHRYFRLIGEIEPRGTLASFSPASPGAQRAVVDAVIEQSTSSGVRPVRVVYAHGPFSKGRSLAAAIGLHTLLDRTPILIEATHGREVDMVNERIWITLREPGSPTKKLDFAPAMRRRLHLVGSVRLDRETRVDLFREIGRERLPRNQAGKGDPDRGNRPEQTESEPTP